MRRTPSQQAGRATPLRRTLGECPRRSAQLRTVLFLATLAVLATSCGRLNFDALTENDAGEVTDAVSQALDAQALDARPLGPSVPLDKITVDGPIFRASDNAVDDSYYLIGTAGDQRASSFVRGGQVYFSLPSKSSDAGTGGWHYSILHWTPGDADAVWVDGDSNAEGNQTVVPRTAIDSNGFQLRNHRTTHLIEGPGGDVLGLSQKFFVASEYPEVTTSGFYWVGVRAPSPEELTGLSFLVDATSVIEVTENDGTWRGSTTRHAELFQLGTSTLIYQTQRNLPTDDTHYIAITRTTDMVGFEKPTQPILTGYSRAQVFKYQGTIYMVAFSDAARRWQLIPGSAFDTFDTSAAMNIELGAALHGTGSWDDTPFLTDLPDNEPRIAGVDVVGEKVYLFYLAGSFGQLVDDPQSAKPNHGAPYDGARGIGVFEVIMPN